MLYARRCSGLALRRGDLLRPVLVPVLWVCACLDAREVDVSEELDDDVDGGGGAMGARGPRGETGRRTGERIGVGGIGMGGDVDVAIVSVVVASVARGCVEGCAVVIAIPLGTGCRTGGDTPAVCIRSAVPTLRVNDGPSTPAPTPSFPVSGITLRRISLEGTARLLVDALGLEFAKYPPDDPRTGDPRGLGDARGLGVPDGERRGRGNRSASSSSIPGGGGTAVFARRGARPLPSKRAEPEPVERVDWPDAERVEECAEASESEEPRASLSSSAMGDERMR